MRTDELILHHYPQSPVSEKVRVVFGIKGLAWRSVEIPRLPPKPDLVPLTGGYRRTPVLQIGADVYCDSQCIIREIDARHPSPTLYPGGGAGMPWSVSRWTDGPLFRTAVAVIFGAGAADLPREFLADRGPLYFGPGFDLDALVRDLPQELAQLRAQLAWVDERLAGGRAFLLGEAPGLPDALVYHLVWFVRGRYAGGEALLAEFPSLCAWAARVRALGHGRPTPMPTHEALAIAAAARPDTAPGSDPRDPQALEPGLRVQITPLGDGGDPPVAGEIVRATIQSLAIRREDDRVGEVVVHFPRVGYRVERV